MKKVFVFGSMNMDLVISCPREILQGETLHGSGFMTNGGGKGANQATACGKLGAHVMMGGCVGNDGFGDTLTKSLSECGVDISAIRRVDGVSTGVAVIVIVNHDNRIILDSGANSVADKEDVDRLLRTAEPGDIFLTQLENRTEIVGYALSAAKAKGMITVLNPAPSDTAVAEYLSCVDYFVPNEKEFYDFTGTDSIEDGARALMRQGVGTVIVTLGSKGYAYFDGQTVHYEGCVDAEVVDTTAAGDTFCGAIVTKLAAGQTIEEALRFANRASAITVSRKGACQSIPTLDEVTALFG